MQATPSRHVDDDAVSAAELVHGSSRSEVVDAEVTYASHPIFADAPAKTSRRSAGDSDGITPPDPAPSTALVPINAPASRTAPQSSAPSAQQWWRRLLRMGPSPADIAMIEDETSMRRPLERPITVAIAQTRGEAGKTVTTFGLGSALSAARGGGVVAWDNNEAPGNLADRLERDNQASIRDLLDAADWFMQPDALLVELERVLQHQSTGFLQVLASDPHGAASIDAEQFATVHAVLRKYYRLVIIDTGNSTRAVNWQVSMRVADVIVVPLKLRSDHMVPAARMIRGLQDAGEDLDGRLILVLSCGPDDRHMSAAEQAQLFAEFGLDRFPLLEIPTDGIINTASQLRWTDLAPATQAAYRRLGALTVELALGSPST